MKSLFLAASALLLTALPSSAATYQFSEPTPGGNTSAGVMSNIFTQYDTTTNIFNWSSTFSPNSSGNIANGAWLVVNDGPNPKGVAGELPIFYLDELQNKVSIFEYNGANGPGSYHTPGNYLGSTYLDVDTDSVNKTFSFEYDATDLNKLSFSPDWKGLSFDESIGIWFHGVNDLQKNYHEGVLDKFNYSSQGWYDVANRDTEKIPEPSVLLGLGILGVVALTKRPVFNQ